MNISLETTCWKCNGDGLISINPKETCPICHGTGGIPTESGVEMIDFITRHIINKNKE